MRWNLKKSLLGSDETTGFLEPRLGRRFKLLEITGLNFSNFQMVNMNDQFDIETGFVEEDSSDPSVLTIGGTVVNGDVCNGAEGGVHIDGRDLRLKVQEVAFLKGAKPGSIMFNVLKPQEFPAAQKWRGIRFGSC